MRQLAITDVLENWPLDKLQALHRVAKKSGRWLFKDPRQMQALRALIERKAAQDGQVPCL